MKQKHYILFILFGCITLLSHAQGGDQKYVDSLKNVIANTPEKNRAELWLELAYAYFDSKGQSLDSTVYAAKEALRLNKKYGRVKNKLKCLFILSNYFIEIGQPKESRAYIDQMFDGYKKHKDTLSLLYAYEALGYNGYFEETRENMVLNYKKAYELQKAYNPSDPKGMSYSIGNLGLAYLELGRLKEMLQLLHENVSYVQDTSIYAGNRALIYHLIGTAKIQQERYKEAIPFLKITLALGKEINSTYDMVSPNIH